jgi:hypothetical protein
MDADRARRRGEAGKNMARRDFLPDFFRHALCDSSRRRLVLPAHREPTSEPRRTAMSMGHKAIFAFLWVIGLPLPIVLILYFLTGGGCN